MISNNPKRSRPARKATILQHKVGNGGQIKRLQVMLTQFYMFFFGVRYDAFEYLLRGGGSAILWPFRKLTLRRYPIFAVESIIFLRKLIRSRDDIRVFEYGMGRSSLWWAKNVHEYYGVEHDEEWYHQIVEKLKKVNPSVEKSRLFYRPFNISREYYGWENWTKPPIKDKHRDIYAETIQQFPDNYFDLVIIDGFERVRCARQVPEKIKPGGMVVIDDYERLKYREADRIFKGWKRKVMGLGIQRTAFFVKPKSV